MDVNQLWDRFENALRRNAHRDYAALRSPATMKQIGEAEAAMDVSLPDAVRHAYLRHDGAEDMLDRTRPGGIFPGMTTWCSLERMVSDWQEMRIVAADLQDSDHDRNLFPPLEDWWDELAISPEWWNVNRIPIGLSITASRIYIDLAPCPQGNVGQVISDSGVQDAILIAPSLNEWIAFVADAFESGRFSTSAEDGDWVDTLWGPHNRRSYSYYGWRSSGALGTGPPK